MEKKLILAYRIISEPKIVDEIQTKYQIIFDKTTEVSNFNYINSAISVMADKGWRCINITATRSSGGSGYASEHYMFALMEKQDKINANNTH